MPAVTVCISRTLEPADRKKLSAAVVKAVAAGMKKPETVVMSMIHDGISMTYQGDCAPVAFVNVQSIAPIPLEARCDTVKLLCSLLEKYGVAPARVLVKFEESGKPDWGTGSLLME